MNDLKKVKLKIKVIDILFDMILFADEKDFEDSVILLKSAINWEYKDMVNLKLNVRETSMKSKLSNVERCILKEWLWADYLMYDHFKQKFSGLIHKYGRKRLGLEKEILRKETHLEEIRCRSKQWKGDTCKFYKMYEETFLDIFKKKQMLHTSFERL